jgi:hypothetical protein
MCRSQDGRSVTSNEITVARPANVSASWSAFSRREWMPSQTRESGVFESSLLATARPIPPLAPVTIATRGFLFGFMCWDFERCWVFGLTPGSSVPNKDGPSGLEV